MPIKLTPALLMLAAAAPAQILAAESFDGTKALLCATVETVECGPQADCKYGTADSLGFPQFLQIDTQKKRISAVRPDGSTLNAVITTVTPLEDRLVMQGVENSLGWAGPSASAGPLAAWPLPSQVTRSFFRYSAPARWTRIDH
mgnify:CR=1 FL=1